MLNELPPLRSALVPLASQHVAAVEQVMAIGREDFQSDRAVITSSLQQLDVMTQINRSGA